MTGEKVNPKKGLREFGFFGLKRLLSHQQPLSTQRATGNRKARIAFHWHTGGHKQKQMSTQEVPMTPSLKHL